MNKTKWLILGGFSFCLAVSCLILFPIKSAKADTSTTFPVDEAGIAAYVKVDNINDDALAEAFKTIEKSGESYVIGRVPVTNEPLVYVGLDGWIVAYFSKDEPASKIAGGKKATTLEDAIDYMCKKTGITYSTSSIKYYDFEFPEANKVTFVTENGRSNSFYITVPGTLYEASYRFYSTYPCSCGWLSCTWPKQFTLSVDGNLVYKKSTNSLSNDFPLYEYLDPSSNFQTGITHYVAFGFGQSCSKSQFATILIYRN